MLHTEKQEGLVSNHSVMYDVNCHALVKYKHKEKRMATKEKLERSLGMRLSILIITLQ